MSSSAESYLRAATTVSDLVGRIHPDAWDGAGLGEWDLRSLVGHTSRAMSTVLTYLQQPADHIGVASPEAYFLAVRRNAQSLDEQAIVERGRQAGRDLGADVADGFRALVRQVGVAVASADPQAVIKTIAGGITVEAYLPTRTFELVVHGLDISAAVDLPVTFTTAALEEIGELAVRLATRLGDGPLVLHALTGRAELPRGFSVLG